MIILVASYKGGVGKTNFAINLAVFLLSKARKIVYIKADKNQEVTKWYERRKRIKRQNLPDLEIIECFGDISAALLEYDKPDTIVIVDSSGHDSSEFRSAATVADILITPACPSSQAEIDNLEPITTTIREIQYLKNEKLRPYVLLNRVKPTRRGVEDSIKIYNQLKYSEYWLTPIKTKISRLDPYVNAFNTGRGVHEMPKSVSGVNRAKAEIELLVQELAILM